MRVIHTVPHVRRAAAGPSYSVPRLCRALGEAGADTLLMTQDTAPLDPSPGFAHKVHAERGWPGRLAPSPSLERALMREPADVIHNHSMWLMANIYPGRAARRRGIPLVMAPRGTLSASALARSRWKKRAVWYFLQRQAFDVSACFHATAEKEYEEIRAFGATAPVAIIPNGIDLPEPVRRPDRAERVLLFLGRIHPIKGLPLLLEVWHGLDPAVRAGWRLQITGPDEEDHQAALQARIDRDAITGVTFCGPVFGVEKDAAYAGADLYILPTETENFGMTVAEALASGIPAIVTQGAPWAGLEEHGCGWWVPRDRAALTAALTDALARPAPVLAEMGAKGRAWMAARFGWDALAREMLTVYTWLARGKTVDTPASVRLT